MTDDSFDTPILIIFWRRPDAVLRVLETLRPLAPTRLFLASDGPRAGNDHEREQVELARQQLEAAMDWPCVIERRYSTFNQGCKHGPANAISWFFEHVEEGIILEDDCLADLSFFHFCRCLLSRYRHDTRVWQISGNNFVEDLAPSDSSYFFAGYTTTWGWATWRRCWQAYDIEMKQWPQIRDSGKLANAFEGQDELDYQRRIWDRLTQENYPATWDYQWNFLCFINGGLSAIPCRNLVSNIGFGEGATHCLNQEDPRSELQSGALATITHPSLVLRDWRRDRAIFANIYAEDGKKKAGPIKEIGLRMYYTAAGIFRKLRGLLAA